MFVQKNKTQMSLLNLYTSPLLVDEGGLKAALTQKIVLKGS